MITEADIFFIDVLKLLFDNSNTVVMIQAPYDELSPFFEKISSSNDGIYEHIELGEENLKMLLLAIINDEFTGYIQSLEIRIGGKKIFEGYDGMEYGMFSKNFNLSKDFTDKYVKNDMLMLSEDW